MKALFKSVANFAALGVMLPFGAVCGFGRFEALYITVAQGVALVPGLPGDYLRAAFCRWTLRAFGNDSRIQFGSYFAHAQAAVGNQVYIGCFSILGCVDIGDRTQIASGVQILSGRRQHPRDEQGRIQGAARGEFQTVRLGADCWIGAGAIVMADVGAGSTIGAGAVAVTAIPERSVAVGNPARVLRSTDGSPEVRSEKPQEGDVAPAPPVS